MDVVDYTAAAARIPHSPKTTRSSHWQERNLCWSNACSCSKEVAIKRRKQGGTIARRSGKHDDCGDRMYQQKGS
jgi:hypothetical protein